MAQTNYYDVLLKALARHLSQTNARLTLDRSIRACGISHRSVTQEDLPRLVPRIKRTVAFFLQSAKLDAFEKDLKTIFSPEGKVDRRRVPVQSEDDIVKARMAARSLATALGGSRLGVQKVATVVSEFARNIVFYTPGGEIELIPQKDPTSVLIRATDRGGGIANLEEVLSGNYRSKTGLGRGILGSRQLAASMDIDTSTVGTKIKAVIKL